MRTIITYIFIIVAVSQGFGQISNGLEVDFQYDQKTNSYSKQQEQLRQAYKYRYSQLKAKYTQQLEINKFSSNPKEDPKQGYYNTTATNGFDFMEKRQVFVENGLVTKYVTGKGSELKVIEGGKIVDFRTVIKTQDGAVCELIFNVLFE